jgi:hypothetical protein
MIDGSVGYMEFDKLEQAFDNFIQKLNIPFFDNFGYFCID